MLNVKTADATCWDNIIQDMRKSGELKEPR